MILLVIDYEIVNKLLRNCQAQAVSTFALGNIVTLGFTLTSVIHSLL